MAIHQEICVQPSYSRWLTEEVLNLIELVRSDEAIYNPRHKYYFCRPYVENFWREIDLRLRKNSGASLAKWTNLRISFRREYANFQDDKIPPCWSYFDRMLFLHPYLRNKKSSEPKNIDPHIQEALAQISSLSYKSQPNTSESPANDYMDQYLSYCEDDPQLTPELDDIIEHEDSNPIPNDIKSEVGNEAEEKDTTTQEENAEYKDIIIEIGDDTQPSSSQTDLNLLSPQNDSINRSLLKRSRVELSATLNSNATTPSNNISLVRPLTLAPHSAEVNSFHNSIASLVNSTNRSEPPSENHATRRNDLCECKTDSDAMFLMSLLPDIRKLNGRDRGKIKIAFQNIVQEFLYPE